MCFHRNWTPMCYQCSLMSHFAACFCTDVLKCPLGAPRHFGTAQVFEVSRMPQAFWGVVECQMHSEALHKTLKHLRYSKSIPNAFNFVQKDCIDEFCNSLQQNRAVLMCCSRGWVEISGCSFEHSGRAGPGAGRRLILLQFWTPQAEEGFVGNYNELSRAKFWEASEATPLKRFWRVTEVCIVKWALN